MTTANDIITYLRTHLSDLSPDEMAMVRPYLAEYGEGERDYLMALFAEPLRYFRKYTEGAGTRWIQPHISDLWLDLGPCLIWVAKISPPIDLDSPEPDPLTERNEHLRSDFFILKPISPVRGVNVEEWLLVLGHIFDCEDLGDFDVWPEEGEYRRVCDAAADVLTLLRHYETQNITELLPLDDLYFEPRDTSIEALQERHKGIYGYRPDGKK